MNNNDLATVNLLYKQTDQIPVANIMLISFGIGIIVGFLMAALSIVSAKNTSRQLRYKNKKLTDELNRLRNVNIDEEALPVENNSEI
jgi:uncharacterized membrane protein YciS (DUF1049 family)